MSANFNYKSNLEQLCFEETNLDDLAKVVRKGNFADPCIKRLVLYGSVYFANRLNAAFDLDIDSVNDIHTDSDDPDYDPCQDRIYKAVYTAKQLIDKLHYLPLIECIPINCDWPQNYFNAIFESAEALLCGVNPEMERSALTIQTGGIESVRTTQQQKFYPQHIVHAIPSSLGWDYLLPILSSDRQVTIERVS